MHLMPMLADVTIGSGGIGQALIFLVVAVIVCGFAWWVIQGYVPEPLKRWAVLILVLMIVLALINFVMGLGGHAFIRW